MLGFLTPADVRRSFIWFLPGGCPLADPDSVHTLHASGAWSRQRRRTGFGREACASLAEAGAPAA